MKQTVKEIYEGLITRYEALRPISEDILSAYKLLKDTFSDGGRLFLAGNGGSASDCEHVVGELLKSFKKPRKIDDATASALSEYGDDGRYLLSTLEGALPAISLISQTGVISAFANDRAWDCAFAQQLYGLGRSGDCLLVLSTSGNSKNCINAVTVAKCKGIKTLALTGEGGGRLRELCDVCISVPAYETYAVQEYHLPIYHTLCAMLEEDFF